MPALITGTAPGFPITPFVLLFKDTIGSVEFSLLDDTDNGIFSIDP
jgi:hypothetical protein